MNMTRWFEDIRKSPAKKAMPILSFPSIQLLGIGVKELISDSDLLARGMKAVADRVDAAASLSMMDLSVEAHAFGSEIRIFDDEIPTVIGHILSTAEQADALAVPAVGAGRTGLYIEAISKAHALITDRPVFAGVIGPFSLAGRLLDVTEAMMYCYDAPEMVHTVLDKVTQFSTAYINAYKAAGANGVVIAEPLAGLLSPALNEEFSAHYVKRIVDAVQTDDFAVVYHNCGGGTPKMVEAISAIGARAYHFGNAIDMAEMLSLFPPDIVVMGNVDPSSQFRNGTPESIREVTLDLLGRCHRHPNFVISSGCDIPPKSSWANIDAFFATVAEFYRDHEFGNP
ncbi:MAG: uroporphyrinogen decarboxylase family protein [Kiritimatiellaeota bacterium]|nr:uroporphyrinogen decarboxylase family protein [Kiritimatiellota bacterium]